jgi:uncharacterized repeat protein (TIGR02543 family)
MSIATKLTSLANDLNTTRDIKGDIKDAIENKGVTVADAPFSDYASKIDLIETGGGGTDITGTHTLNAILEVNMTEGDTVLARNSYNYDTGLGKLDNPSTLPTGVGFDVAFSSDDTYMSVGHLTTPYVTIYKRSGDTFTKLDNPSTLPTGTGYGVAFSSDDTYMSVAHTIAPYVTIYNSENYQGVIAQKANNRIFGITQVAHVGYIAESGLATQEKSFKSLFRRENTYRIYYYFNGGTAHASTVTSFNDPSEFPITLHAPTRAGFTFNGWFDNKALTGTAQMEITVLKGLYQFYAKWTAS